MLLTPQETAQKLRVSTRTLQAWRSQGTVPLPYVKLSGGNVRYREDEVEKFIVGRTVGEGHSDLKVAQ